MLALEQLQISMMQALDHGPDFLPEHLFAGSQERILAGMKVHANTISHARLVALEDTFPRTREWLGHGPFNAHSRLYLEQRGVTGRALAGIGELFPDHLAEHGGDLLAIDLARFEWLWLEAYHAAEAPWLRLADLAGIDPQALVEIAVTAHPAASAGCFAPAVSQLIGVEVPGLADAHAILLTRPDGEVLVTPATAAMDAILSAAKNSVSIGNLLAGQGEPDCKNQMVPDGVMSALIALLEAGALQQVD
ncbi:HvfC/BufC family peptide modification chaperone [Novosphingobium sp. B 225]|uniref:HvfC/BufC family peptide modification chaperone n=1 Tax=Novosphingobium sp. B 225 TaxID=1961849 RepID=UPI0020CD77A0|nr:putative DNA-binding domain-containing protein [Novosphingobium sp. B 225]